LTYGVNKTETKSLKSLTVTVHKLTVTYCAQAYSDIIISAQDNNAHLSLACSVTSDMSRATLGCRQHRLRNVGYNTAHKWWKVTTVYRDGAVLSLIICPKNLLAKEQTEETAIFHTNLFDGQELHFLETIPVVVIPPHGCSLFRRQDSS